MFVAAPKIDYCYVLKSQRQVLLKLLKLFLGDCNSFASVLSALLVFWKKASVGSGWSFFIVVFLVFVFSQVSFAWLLSFN